jgi:hypothetical protein
MLLARLVSCRAPTAIASSRKLQRNTLCGVASVRTSGDFTGFSLSVVGPDSVAGCARGATVTFRVDGRPAATTAVNDFRSVRLST